MIAAGNLMVNRLVLLGYPLHPPGKPDQRRDAHLHGITVPMLFFAGTRDPLCRLELLQPVLHALTAPWELEVIDGADHSFKLPKSSLLSEQQVYAKMLKRMVAWISGTQDNR
jgi:hypothetical protein